MSSNRRKPARAARSSVALIEQLEDRRLMCADPHEAALLPASHFTNFALTTALLNAATSEAPLASRDIGAVGATGSSSVSDGVYTVAGSGADIWQTNDAFRFTSQSLTGDGTIVARVTAQQNTDPWARAGIMMRETTATNSRFTMVAVTPGNGTFFLGRSSTGGTAWRSSNPSYSAPLWLKLTRTGNTFVGYRSTNGTTWIESGRSTIAMGSTIQVGLAVTSHKVGTLSTVTFDNVTFPTPLPTDNDTAPTAPSQLSAAPQSGPQVSLAWSDNSSNETLFRVQRSTNGGSNWSDLATVGANVTTYVDVSVQAGQSYAYRVRAENAAGPSAYTAMVSGTVPQPAVGNWTGNDIGNVGASGSNSTSNGVHTIAGSGSDIWHANDSFRFVHQMMTGDGTIVARVTSQQNTGTWARAGIMIRESLASNSKNVLATASPSGTFVSQRVSTGGSTSGSATTSTALPIWLKLTRTGSVIQSFRSTNGTTWTATGTVTVSMNSTVYVGLAVCSHKAGTLSTAKFDNVAVTAQAAKWVSVADAPVPKYEHAGLAVGGKLYSLGGFYNTAIAATTKSEYYDPATNSWTSIRDLPEPVTHAGQATDGRYIYLVGGFIGNHPGPMTNHVWRYDTQTNTYAALPNLPELVGSGAAAIVGRTLYFFGGTNRVDNYYRNDSNKTWALDLDNTTAGWKAKANLPVARNHLGGVALNGLVYAVGGQKLGSEISGNVDTVNVYNPATNVWSTVASLPILQGHIVSSTFIFNGKIRVIGGVTQNSLELDTHFEYDPAANKWVTLDPIPGRRQSPLADVIDGVIYVTGGYEPGKVYTTTWRSK